MANVQLTVPNLPEWTNTTWFNSLMFLLVIAAVTIEASGAEWAVTWVRIINAVLGVCGAAGPFRLRGC